MPCRRLLNRRIDLLLRKPAIDIQRLEGSFKPFAAACGLLQDRY